MFIKSDRSRRMNLDVIGQLEDELEDDGLNYDLWIKLINQVLAKDKEEQVRSVMNKYLSIFKFDGEQWCNYINYEMSRGEFGSVQELFKKCLGDTTSVSLFRLYVSYVRRMNDVITGGDKARGTVIQAFEFAVKRVGIDLNSFDLWEDYIEFLKSWTPAQTWEQQQKVDLIRKTYKKVLQIPSDKLEKLWAVYTVWENDINPGTAKKFIGEKSADYMLARSWYTEWSNITKRSLRKEVFIPFNLFDENESHKELIRRQMNLWFSWIELEKKNKLELKDDSLVQQRIEYAYRQALSKIPFSPDLWFYFTKFWLSANEEANLNKCIDILNEGIILNPRSSLLTYEISELYEKDANFPKAAEAYQNLISVLTKDYDRVTESINDVLKKSELPISSTLNVEVEKDGDEDDDDPYIVDEELSQAKLKLSQFEVDQLAKYHNIQKQLNKVTTLAYTKYMISSKRSGGIKEARGVFKNARQKFKSIGYDFYVQNALLEYYSDNRNTANKVFQLGMKLFNKNGDFLLKYLDYMIMINDIENMRVLFEQGLTTLLREITSETEGIQETPNSPLEGYYKKLKDIDINEKKESIRSMFKKYSKFETNYGDLNGVRSLESRYEQYFPEDDPLDLFSDRYTDSGSLDVIKTYDLGLPEDAVKAGTTSVFKKRKLEISGLLAASDIKPDDSYDPMNIDALLTLDEPDQLFVGSATYSLLRSLPSAQFFGGTKDRAFDSAKVVELLANLPKFPGLQ